MSPSSSPLHLLILQLPSPTTPSHTNQGDLVLLHPTMSNTLGQIEAHSMPQLPHCPYHSLIYDLGEVTTLTPTYMESQIN